MTNVSPNTYTHEIIGGVFEVASHFVGKSIIESLRKNFTGHGKVQRGDFYMNQSRELLQRHLQLIELDDQTTIRQKYSDARDLKRRLGDASDSRFRRFFLSMQYRRLSKETYVIVEEASNRAVDDTLMNQMDEATRETADPESTAVHSQPTPRNPFTDSHAAASTLSTAIGDVNRVQVETYRSEATGEAAVVLGIHRQNAPAEHVVSTFDSSILSNDDMKRAETSN